MENTNNSESYHVLISGLDLQKRIVSASSFVFKCMFTGYNADQTHVLLKEASFCIGMFNNVLKDEVTLPIPEIESDDNFTEFELKPIKTLIVFMQTVHKFIDEAHELRASRLELHSNSHLYAEQAWMKLHMASSWISDEIECLKKDENLEKEKEIVKDGVDI